MLYGIVHINGTKSPTDGDTSASMIYVDSTASGRGSQRLGRFVGVPVA